MLTAGLESKKQARNRTQRAMHEPRSKVMSGVKVPTHLIESMIDKLELFERKCACHLTNATSSGMRMQTNVPQSEVRIVGSRDYQCNVVAT